MFVCACTGLAVSDIALILSRHLVALLLGLIYCSFSKDCIHMILAVVLAILLYSASVLDLQTVDCFLADRDIGCFQEK